jgi:hypothetical protein
LDRGGHVRFRDDWKIAGTMDRFDGQVDVEIRPVQMPGALELDVQQVPDTRFLEPRDVFERQEVLTIADE